MRATTKIRQWQEGEAAEQFELAGGLESALLGKITELAADQIKRSGGDPLTITVDLKITGLQTLKTPNPADAEDA